MKNKADNSLLPPLSLYVHIPWCVRKCPYCDFNSHTAETIPEDEYVDQLIKDLHSQIPWVENRPLTSIFFGGGTPSLFSPAAIAKILDAADQSIGFEDDIEITLEANPGTVEQQRFAGFRKAGINRLSIGVQSLQQKHLQKLGRIHSAEEALGAIKAAQDTGFDNINVDLMHGLPHQTVTEAIDDLLRIINLQPQHLSWYQLTIEKNTAFYNHPPALPNEDCLGQIEAEGKALIADNNFHHYEISAYSQPGYAAKHNMNYWEFGDYLGIGAGAHGKVSTGSVGTYSINTLLRSQRTRSPNDYLTTDFGQHPPFKPVAPDLARFEFMLNALRLIEGVPADYFMQRTGQSLQTLEPTLQQLRERDLMVRSEVRLQATPLGQQFLDDVVSAFMPETG